MGEYHGVYYRPRDKHYAPRVYADGHRVYLKTFPDAETAARVRDIAERWLHAGKAHLNFEDRVIPDGLTERIILRWILESGVSLPYLLCRVPLPLLISAGVSDYALIGAGVAMEHVNAARKELAA